MSADINKRTGSGPRVCAEGGCYWHLKTNVDSNFGSSSGKMQSFIAIQPFFFPKLGDDYLDICSKCVNFYAPGMVKTWGQPAFCGTYPVFTPY